MSWLRGEISAVKCSCRAIRRLTLASHKRSDNDKNRGCEVHWALPQFSRHCRPEESRDGQSCDGRGNKGPPPFKERLLERCSEGNMKRCLHGR